MFFSLILLILVLAVSTWAFLRYSPRGSDPRRVVRFNASVLVIGVIGCGALTIKLYLALATSQDRAWWPVIAGLYSLALFSAVLLVGALVRNLLVFRPRRGSGPRP
jgi:hypothetical protein